MSDVSAAAALSQAHGGEVLLMAPRRATAAHLRDALAAHGTPGVRVATPAALGYSVLRAAALAAGRGEPSLVTGAEQDALLADLIAAFAASSSAKNDCISAAAAASPTSPPPSLMHWPVACAGASWR